MSTSPDICAVNLRTRIAIADNGKFGPITTLLDRFGEKTDLDEEAITAIAEIKHHGWFVIDLTQFELVRSH